MHIDLSNNTKYPDVHEYIGFNSWGLLYMHLQFWMTSPMAVIGNLIVLYTSLRYKSLNMDRVSSALLENLAAADLILSIVGGWPIYITVCANSWVLGKVGCVFNLFVTNIGGTCEILTLATISLYRAVLLRNLFFLRGVSQQKITLTLILLWATACIPSLTSLLTDSTVYYSPEQMSCTSSAYSLLPALVYSLTFLLLGLPMLTLLISNIAMLVVAVRYGISRKRSSSASEQDVNMTAVITVTCVCWLFIFSWVPYVIRVMCNASDVYIPRWYFTFQAHFLALNVCFNPIIYSFTNKSFKKVVKKRVFDALIESVRNVFRR